MTCRTKASRPECVIPRLYIAAPFFNPRQTELVANIEKACSEHGVDFFSPRLQHNINPGVTQPVPTIGSADMAQTVFDRNFTEIKECTHMLAVLSFLLGEEQELRIVKESKADGLPCPLYEPVPWNGKPLALPDVGTIWEMGVAYTLKMPTIGLVAGGHGYMNLMITQSMRGVIDEGEGLQKFCEGLSMGRVVCGPWKGSYR